MEITPTQSRPARPISVTLLALLVLTIAGLNLVRLALSVQQWSYLKTLPGVSPLYLAGSGLVWTLAGLPLAWGLLRGLGWAPRLMQALALSYAAYYWLDQIFLVDHPLNLPAESGLASRALLPVNWPFAAGLTFVLLAWTAWTLSRPKVKAFFDQPAILDVTSQ
jgi:hypothetical protein